jgi:DNA-directed RNA polymerase specialized sigma24 family protein
MPEKPEVTDHYRAHYRDFDAAVYADTRRDAFGEDIGQNSWLTLTELDRFEGRQTFFETVASLATARRLSRLAYVARK